VKKFLKKKQEGYKPYDMKDFEQTQGSDEEVKMEESLIGDGNL